jgi:HK97 family phage prohead protease
MSQYTVKTIKPDEFDRYGIKKEYCVDSMLETEEVEYEYVDDNKDLELQDVEEFEDELLKGPINGKKRKRKLTMKSTNPNARETGRIIKGFAGTVDKDRVDDIIPIDTFIGARKDLLKAGSSTMFFNHDTNRPIGIVASTAIDRSKGLFFEGFISKAADVEDIWTKADEGILNSFSVRLRPQEVDVKERKDGSIEAFIIKKMKLIEVSLVGIPANPNASVTEVISKSFDDAINNYNKQRVKTMPDEKINTVKDLVEKSVGDTLKGTLDELFVKFEESVDNKLKNFKADLETEKAEAAQKVEDEAKALEEKEKADKEKAEQEAVLKAADATSAAILTALQNLNDSVKDLKTAEPAPSKKSVEEEIEDNKPKAIVKTLKSATDHDTIRYIYGKLNDSEKEFNSLDDEEKDTAKALMFETYVAMNSK